MVPAVTYISPFQCPFACHYMCLLCMHYMFTEFLIVIHLEWIYLSPNVSTSFSAFLVYNMIGRHVVISNDRK